jgi:hypothetical protein
VDERAAGTPALNCARRTPASWTSSSGSSASGSLRIRTVRRYLSEPVVVGEPSKVLPAEAKSYRSLRCLFDRHRPWAEAGADTSRHDKLCEGDLGNITDVCERRICPTCGCGDTATARIACYDFQIALSRVRSSACETSNVSFTGRAVRAERNRNFGALAQRSLSDNRARSPLRLAICVTSYVRRLVGA